LTPKILNKSSGFFFACFRRLSARH
jgi:hypothetical protein